MRDLNEEDPAEVRAGKANLNFIALTGNIGCLVNGAGLAMSTMDIIKYHGGSPANFLDVGGGASPERIATALKLVLSDAKVKAVLVNIFAGINRCDWVAKGVVQACQTVDVKVPLVVRLAGTNVEEGRRILADSGLELITAETLAEAAEKAVAACNAAQEPARARA
jgi:malate-CoA ligase subunit beta